MTDDWQVLVACTVCGYVPFSELKSTVGSRVTLAPCLSVQWQDWDTRSGQIGLLGVSHRRWRLLQAVVTATDCIYATHGSMWTGRMCIQPSSGQSQLRASVWETMEDPHVSQE